MKKYDDEEAAILYKRRLHKNGRVSYTYDRFSRRDTFTVEIKKRVDMGGYGISTYQHKVNGMCIDCIDYEEDRVGKP